MPHYYFHLHNGDGPTPDEEGQDLPGPAEAYAAALADIRSILASEIDDGLMNLDGRIEVVDCDGAVILTVPFTDAVDVQPPGVQNR